MLTYKEERALEALYYSGTPIPSDLELTEEQKDYLDYLALEEAYEHQLSHMAETHCGAISEYETELPW